MFRPSAWQRRFVDSYAKYSTSRVCAVTNAGTEIAQNTPHLLTAVEGAGAGAGEDAIAYTRATLTTTGRIFLPVAREMKG